MVDLVSIIISIVSLVGSVGAAAFTGWITYYIDEVKQRKATKALIHKYRDPLTLAAWELQSRCFGLIEGGLLSYAEKQEKAELVVTYTAFTIGQYLSWVNILRRQAQFVSFATDATNKRFNHLLDTIEAVFSIDSHAGEGAFMLWRGEQMAIGESMTLTEEGSQLYCMGFAAFSSKYKTDEEFKRWFVPIEKGMVELRQAAKDGNPVAFNRLRRLQHCLVDLVLLLDAQRVEAAPYKKKKVDAAHMCKCDGCPGANAVVAKESPMQKV